MEITGQPDLPWLLLGQIRSRSEILWGRAALLGWRRAEQSLAAWCWAVSEWRGAWLQGPSAEPGGAVCSFSAGASSAPYLEAAPQPQLPPEVLPAWFPALHHLQPVWNCSALLTNSGGAYCCSVKHLCIGMQRPSCAKSENAGSVSVFNSGWIGF